MTVNASRLGEQLHKDNFQLIWRDDRQYSAVFARPSIAGGLFERLEVSGGESGSHQTAWADIGISVIHGPSPTKGLVVLQLLEEAASDSEHGWSILRNDYEASAWERKVADLAGNRSRSLAVEVGDKLLTATQCARLAANRYADLLVGHNTLSSATAWVRSNCTPAQVQEAEGVVEWPGVVQLIGGQPIYELACLTVAAFSETVEGKPNRLASVDPIRDRETMWCIQILVDLLCRPNRIPQPLFSWRESDSHIG